MMQYFHRQVQLWGESTQELLQTKKIAIIGCGGLGSSLAYALGASGIGEIHLVDFDEVSIHNIHRCIDFYLHRMDSAYDSGNCRCSTDGWSGYLRRILQRRAGH